MGLDNWTKRLFLVEKVWQPFEYCVLEGNAGMINVIGKVVWRILVVVFVFSL
jgi:hypothetical protein